MPRFYFHLHNDIDIPDDLGVDLPSFDAAIAHGLDEARHLASQIVLETGRIVLSHRIDIEDEDGTVLDSVQFGDVLKVED
jgi:hypothetical protein